MEFKEFRELLREHVGKMLKDAPVAFYVAVDKDQLWNTYLDSFPAGTNTLFRKRREFDCSCCNSFIRAFGNVVTIDPKTFEVTTIWDFQAAHPYTTVLQALSNLVKSCPVAGVFTVRQSAFGTDSNYETTEGMQVVTWNHFQVDLPKHIIYKGSESLGTAEATFRTNKEVLQRSLTELSDAGTVLDMIEEGMLYRADEWKGALQTFQTLQTAYYKVPEALQANFCWIKSVEVGPVVSKIRNHSIGVLLQDLSSGEMDIDSAVRRYRSVMDPNNYKRPTETNYTHRMVDAAYKTIVELGFENSLGRRFATLGDVSVADVIYADRDAIPHMDGVGGIMAALKQQAAEKPQNFEHVPTVGIEQFLAEVLPEATTLEVLFENKHQGNLVSLIAPQDTTAPSMFKWGNNFSWAYAGNLTDSEMKQRVKAAGGKVDGVLRFSLQWDHQDDLDAHCVEPNGNHIYFPNKFQVHPSTGRLDVDIINPTRGKPSVENITWTDLGRMQRGDYHFYVNCYTMRERSGGFEAEVEFGGQIYKFEHVIPLKHKEDVSVALVRYDGKSFELVKSLAHSYSSVDKWNLKTNSFQRVSLLCLSPNYWQGRGIGNKHYMFMLAGCRNDTTPNGFYNEYLQESLLKHKHVFAALGSMMKVEPSEDQLSGLGFSSTKRDSLIVRVNGQRVMKVIF